MTAPVAVVTDEEVFDKWDGTFIFFGSSDSNIKTFELECLQSFYKFEFGAAGHRVFNVGGKIYSANHAILLRVRNPYHREHFAFVCAGLGEWGASGAAYYLFHRWRELYKKFKDRDFCLVIEVAHRSDESARVVHEVIC